MASTELSAERVPCAGGLLSAESPEHLLPPKWTDDRARRDAAGIPCRTGVATKPLLALGKIRRFCLARHRLRWVVGDEAYDADPELPDWLKNTRSASCSGSGATSR